MVSVKGKPVVSTDEMRAEPDRLAAYVRLVAITKAGRGISSGGKIMATATDNQIFAHSDILLG